MSRALTRGVPYWSPIIVMALVVLVLYWLWDVLVIFLIAGFLAFLLRPVVDWIERWTVRFLAILMVYLAVILALILIGVLVVPLIVEQVQGFIDSLPQLIAQGRELFNNIQSSYVALPESWQNLIDRGLEELQAAAARFTREAIPVVVQAVAWVVTLFIIPVLTFFILLGYNGYGRMILALTPRHSRPSVVSLGRQLNDALWAFVRGQFLLMLAVGVATGVGLYLVGMPYPVVFGIIAGLLEVIPNFGPTITFVILVLIGLAISPFTALKAGAVAVGVQLLENAFLAPVVLAKAVDVSPVTVALAIFIGGALGGAIGVLAAIPIAVMIKVVLLFYYAQGSDVVEAGRRCRAEE